MEDLLASLNKEQKEAATSIYGPLLVLAGAGTGKTKVITTRIAWMLANGISPESILAVSFTNKAAKEMKERLCRLYKKSVSTKVELSTFHSFTLGLLRRHAKEFGFSNHFSIADEGESLALIKEVLKENKLDELISLPDAKAKISFYKDALYESDTFNKQYNIFLFNQKTTI
ncbi:MAG: UvrD-helicase domain-containing protein [Silvanigrellaceae bacterium]|nr:UvrD-helicase domain-containing protein [Silvanigrellaceae bacterium]